MTRLLSIIGLATFLFASIVIAQGQPKAGSPLFVEISQFRWIDDRSSIFLSADRRVYYSNNEGEQYYDITSQLMNATVRNQAPEYIYPSDVNSSYVYIRGRGSISWRSDDKGETWEAVYPRLAFRNFVWHPHNPEWILSSVYTTSNDPVCKLYFSRDFGATWSLIFSSVYNDYPTSYGWIDAGQGQVLERTIYFIEKTTESDGTKSRDAFHLMVTADWGNTRQQVLSHCYAFVDMTRHIYAATYTVSEMETVLKVTDTKGALIKTWREAEFPFGDELDYQGFVLLDDSSGAVYVGVSHRDPAAAYWGNLYVSDGSGAYFTTSFEHLSQDFPSYDFDSLQGLEGAFLANYLYNWETVSTRNPVQLQTYLTYNNGGEWFQLQAPDTDSNGDPYDCTGPCYLHLHGWTNSGEFGPFYSRESAIGIIVATGNVGRFLSTDPALTSTFLSRDGGITWNEIAKENYIYEVGDHGGLIIFGSLSKPTNKIYYTTTEATTDLKEFKFITTGAINIENIIIYPSSTGRKFVITGSTEETSPRSVVVGIDFSNIWTQNCDDSDYEEWSPSDNREDLHGSPCMLGRISTFRRRRPSADCWNDRNTDHLISTQNCNCSIEDYECDFGFVVPESDQSICVWGDAGPPPVYPPANCPAGTTYTKSRGYRLVATDSCVGGEDHRPEVVSCPAAPVIASSGFVPSSGNGWVIAVVIVVILVVVCLCVGGIFCFMNNERFRRMVPFAEKIRGRAPYLGIRKEPNTLLDDDDLEIRKPDSDDESDRKHRSEPDLIKIVESNKTPFSIDDSEFNPRKN